MISSCVLDLVHDAAFFDEHADIITGKFPGGPGGHNGKPFGILDQQPGGTLLPSISPDTIK